MSFIGFVGVKRVVALCALFTMVAGLVPTAAYAVDEELPPQVVDMCANIEGSQLTVPEGYSQSGENCDLIAVPEVPDTVDISYPNDEDNAVYGETTFSADYTDNDETPDDFEWFVKASVCEEAGEVVAGNIDGFDDSYRNGTTSIFMDVDASLWLNGDYCLVVDPIEQGEEADVYDAQDFVVANPVQTVSGYKYEDTNKNGAIDEGDAPVAGWTIYALDSDREWAFETETDADGYYSFELQQGTWTILEADKRGWEQVLAEDYSYDEIMIDEEVAPAEAQLICEFTLGGYASKIRSRYSEEGYRCDFLNVRSEKHSSSGTRVNRSSTPAGQVLGAATTTATTTATATPAMIIAPAPQCDGGMYLKTYLRLGAVNDAAEVTKLQQFLQIHGATTSTTSVTGVFDAATDAAVKAFQAQYTTDILSPWSIGLAPTGYVYKLTRWKINNIMCPGSEALPTIK